MFGFGRKQSAAPAVSRPRRSGPPPLLARSGRFALVVFAVSLAFVAVGLRLVWLHVVDVNVLFGSYAPRLFGPNAVDAPHLRAYAGEKRRTFRPQLAQRGRILDSRGGVFATSREVWDVVVDPGSFTPEQESRLGDIADSVAKLVGKSRLQVLDILQKRLRGVADEESEKPATDLGNEAAVPGDASDASDADEKSLGEKNRRLIRWAKIAEGVDLKTRDAIAALHVRSIYSERRFEREYPRERLAAQLIGYVNKIGQPSMGIEKTFDFFLKGEDGGIDSLQNKKGQEMADRRIHEIAPSDGQSVELTIDPIIQQAAEEELTKACKEYNPEWGIAIVSEAQTGKLLALTNWPTFNLNEYNDPVKAPMAAQKNRAVTDVYEPGSVFKIVSYSAALQEGLITPDKMIDCGPNHRTPFFAPYKGKMYQLPKDDEDLGRIDVRKAIAKSSNRAAAQIGMLVAEARGEDKLYEYMAGFGFGSRTGLVTGTEVAGTLWAPSKWQWSTKAATITRMPMGHTVDVTALQTHYAMGVIASGGDLLAPMLVSRVTDKSGESVCDFTPVVRKHTIRKDTARMVATLLRGVVTDGTGKKAEIPGYDVAGKTGTTSMLVKDPATGKMYYSDTENVASFCGFFPADKPQVVISVIMANPRGKGQSFGGTYSAPVFKSIAERVIAWLKLPPSNQAAYEAALAKELKKSGKTPPAPARPSGGLILEPF
jgi:cell division protein FtsI (penicillin-binding protein 3)